MSALSDNARGALLMSASMAGFVVNDALMKLVSGEMSLYQAMLLRGIAATALLGALAWARGALRPTVAPADGPRLALRTACEAGATLCFLTALFNMPIANATAILQTLPLTVTLGAAILFREPVGWRRLGAIAVGFLGVLAIIRPGLAGFDATGLWALAAVGFVTVRDLVTRRFDKGLPSLFVALLTASAITLTGGVGVILTGLRAPPVWTLLALAGAATALAGAYLSAVATMRVGEIAVVSPFRYTILIWAILLGWALFGEIPDAMTVLGAATVAVAGLYALRRERIRRVRG